MNAYRAIKSDFLPSSETVTFRNRETAIASAIEGGDAASVHEHAPDPMIYRAASELIRLDDEGQKTDIEAQGKPYDVLTQVAEKLMEAGASRFAAGKIFETLESYITGLGADFARQAKAKPLYARVMVTDREPQDIPDCALTSVTCIDGTRVQGSDASRVVLQNTIFGTRMSQSSSMSMEKVFESGKQKWLLIYYGTIEGGDLNGFDTVDADMTALVQAVGPVAAASAAGGEMREAIQNGTIAPEMADLVRNIAELNRLTEAAKTPGAVEDASAKIAELKAAITQLTQTISNFEAIPPVLAAAIVTAFEQSEPAVLSTQMPDAESVQDIVAAMMADNDNQIENAVEHSKAVIEQIKEILKDENLPAEIKEVLTLAVEKANLAIEENDIKALAQGMSEIREIVTEAAASETLPQNIFAALSEIAPAVAIAEKEAIAVLPETRAEKIMQTIEAIESKIESGAIDKKDPALADLVKTIADIKDALKGKNREAAVQKIIDVLEKKPEGATLSLAMAAMAQKMSEPAVMEKIPADIRGEIVKNAIDIKTAIQPPEAQKTEIFKKAENVFSPKILEEIKQVAVKPVEAVVVLPKLSTIFLKDTTIPQHATPTVVPYVSPAPTSKVISFVTPAPVTGPVVTPILLAVPNNPPVPSAPVSPTSNPAPSVPSGPPAPKQPVSVSPLPAQPTPRPNPKENSMSVNPKSKDGIPPTPIPKSTDAPKPAPKNDPAPPKQEVDAVPRRDKITGEGKKFETANSKDPSQLTITYSVKQPDLLISQLTRFTPNDPAVQNRLKDVVREIENGALKQETLEKYVETIGSKENRSEAIRIISENAKLIVVDPRRNLELPPKPQPFGGGGGGGPEKKCGGLDCDSCKICFTTASDPEKGDGTPRTPTPTHKETADRHDLSQYGLPSKPAKLGL